MQHLEDKFSNLRIYVDKEIYVLKEDTKKSHTDLREAMHMSEVNHTNLYDQVQKQATEIYDLTQGVEGAFGKIDSCIYGILNMKEHLSDMHLDEVLSRMKMRKIFRNCKKKYVPHFRRFKLRSFV